MSVYRIRFLSKLMNDIEDKIINIHIMYLYKYLYHVHTYTIP